MVSPVNHSSPESRWRDEPLLDTRWMLSTLGATRIIALLIERTQQDFRGHLLLRLRGRDLDLPVSRTFAHRFEQM